MCRLPMSHEKNVNDIDNGNDDTCQSLFRALGRLINLNPDDEEDEYGYGSSIDSGDGGGIGGNRYHVGIYGICT